MILVMSIASILIVLQAAISLLTQVQSLPASQQATMLPVVQSIANQAVIMATEALQEPTSTPLGSASSQIGISPEAIGTSSPSSLTINVTEPVASSVPVAPTITPSCTLTGTVVGVPDAPRARQVSWKWTLQGMATDTPGWLFYNTSDRSIIRGRNGEIANASPLVIQPQPTLTGGVDQGQKAVFGEATCYAYFAGKRTNLGDAGYPIGEVSTTTPQ